MTGNLVDSFWVKFWVDYTIELYYVAILCGSKFTMLKAHFHVLKCRWARFCFLFHFAAAKATFKSSNYPLDAEHGFN